MKIGFADEQVVAALQLGFELGLDDELQDLTRRMEELGRSSQGGVRMASLDDFKGLRPSIPPAGQSAEHRVPRSAIADSSDSAAAEPDARRDLSQLS